MQVTDCDDGFTDVHGSKLVKLNTLNMCSLLYTNWTPKRGQKYHKQIITQTGKTNGSKPEKEYCSY